MPFLKPCILFSAAAILASILGPWRDDDMLSSFTFDHQARELVKAHKHAACAKNNSCPIARPPSTRHTAERTCSTCLQTVEIVRKLGGGAVDPSVERPARAQLFGDRKINRSKRLCPGLTDALGSRSTAHGAPGQDSPAATASLPSSLGPPTWGASCRGPHHRGLRKGTAGSAAASSTLATGRGSVPLVYVYTFMDGAHETLLAGEASAPFFDPYHQHNQFLSEFAFHRSLLASSFVTPDPKHASFFFVPFYSRVALANRTSQTAMLMQLKRGAPIPSPRPLVRPHSRPISSPAQSLLRTIRSSMLSDLDESLRLHFVTQSLTLLSHAFPQGSTPHRIGGAPLARITCSSSPLPGRWSISSATSSSRI